MQFSKKLLFVAALAVPLTNAQLSALPACALAPAVAALGATGCAATDIACVCKATSFITSLIPAIQAACSPADFAAAGQAAIVLCAQAGVTLTLPTAPASSAAAPVTTSSTVTKTTTVLSSSPAAVTTSAAASTSAKASTTVVVTTAASNSTTTKASPSTFTGAANAVTGSAAAAGVFGLAMLFLGL